MATIVTRAGKGSPLTHNEVDANFTNLNTDKLESGSTAASLTITSVDINGGTIDGAVIDGRDVAADGTKLDGIEAGADVTDTANVTAAGALMDSELTNEAAVKALNQGVATTDSPTFAGLTVNTSSYPTSGSLSNRNKIINGNFGINQRGVSGTVTLSAGAYGHDRWKAGASGCTYTFATSANVTTITISAGSLVQVIEGVNLQSGTHVLSWTGTVQMTINGGSAGNSGMTGTLTGGTNATVETSGTGTLSLVQLEAGDTATPFEVRSYGQELALCQRYYETGGNQTIWGGNTTSGSSYYMFVRYSVTKRAAPTVVTTHAAASGFNSSNPAVTSQADVFSAVKAANATASGAYFQFSWTSSAEL